MHLRCIKCIVLINGRLADQTVNKSQHFPPSPMSLSTQIGDADSERKDRLCRICTSHFNGWHVYVETLLDYGVYRVLKSSFYGYLLNRFAPNPTHTVKCPPPPRPSADYLQRRCYKFGNFLRRQLLADTLGVYLTS
jgi:hypothetical protein